MVWPSASSTPAVPPAIISRFAGRMAAMCAASTSALTLRSTPPASTPTLAITGMQPMPVRSPSSDASVASGSPTSPRSADFARHRPERRRAPRQPDASVRSRETHCTSAGSANRRDERSVRPAREHRDDGVERCLIGDAQAVDEARRLAPGAQLRVDRAAAAMHHDDRRRGSHADDRLRCGVDRRRVFQQFAAEFEDRRHLSVRCWLFAASCLVRLSVLSV